MMKLNHLFLGFLLLFLAENLKAQVDYDKYPKASSTYFLQDVYVYQDGKLSSDLTNLVLQDGVIKEIGARVNEPKGAIVLKFDSMYVYPAFIDVLSHPIKAVEAKEKTKVKFPGLPPDAVAGITPQLKMSNTLKTEKVNFDKMRSNGFGISQVAFNKGMLPGNTNITLLTDEKDQYFITNQSNQVLQFKGASGYYPTTIIGVMAKFRDLYRNAENYSTNQVRYQSNAERAKLPSTSLAIEAMVPMTKKQQTVYVKTNKKLNNLRAIQLQKELGFDAVLVNPVDIKGLESDIKESRLPIALSSKLPKKVEKPEKDPDSLYTDSDLEILELKERQYKAYQARINIASEAYKANIPLAFALLDNNGGEIKKTLNIMIEGGLTEKQALDALTVNPAKLLKIDNLVGKIKTGKLSNLIITNQPYFEEKSKIRGVIVGTEVHTYEEKKKDNKKSGEAIDPIGKWEFSLDTPDGENSGKIVIEESGSSYTVTLSQDEDPDDTEVIEDVSLEDNIMELKFQINEGSFSANVEMTLNFIDAETLEGSVKYGDFGTFPLKGSKLSSPE